MSVSNSKPSLICPPLYVTMKSNFQSNNGWSSSQMEASVWGSLPEHLLEHTLAFLPLESLLRMRTVCKKWSDILTAPRFRKLHAEVSPRNQPWFIVSTSKRRFSAYDINFDKWNLLSVPCLPDPDVGVLASSHGLVCFGFRWGELTSTDFYICNPVTKDWKRLPQHPEKTVDHFGLTYDRKADTYKILTMNVASTGACIRNVTVYDSKSKQWSAGVVPRSSNHFSKAPMVWCRGCFYLMDRIRPFCELYAYNLEHSTWHELQCPSPLYFEFPSLVACNDQLFMAGLRSDCRKLWKIVEQVGSGLEFVDCDTLPVQLPNEFGVKKTQMVGAGRCANYNPFRLNAVGSGNLICFSSNLDHSWVLIYDTERRSFHWSPKDVSDVHLSDYADVSFEPCLDASP